MPAATATTPLVSPCGWTGVERFVVLLSPSWPWLLLPQAHADPFTTARPWLEPAEIPATPVRLRTSTGFVYPETFPWPSWPLALSPAAQTLPSDRKATV